MSTVRKRRIKKQNVQHNIVNILCNYKMLIRLNDLGQTPHFAAFIFHEGDESQAYTWIVIDY